MPAGSPSVGQTLCPLGRGRSITLTPSHPRLAARWGLWSSHPSLPVGTRALAPAPVVFKVLPPPPASVGRARAVSGVGREGIRGPTASAVLQLPTTHGGSADPEPDTGTSVPSTQVPPAAPHPLRHSPGTRRSSQGGCTDAAAASRCRSPSPRPGAKACPSRRAARGRRFSGSILGPLGAASCRAGMLLALFVLAPLGFFLHASRLELGRSQWVYK